MPQMKPMAWLFIMFLIIICLAITITVIYFSSHPGPSNPGPFSKAPENLWKWSW